MLQMRHCINILEYVSFPCSRVKSIDEPMRDDESKEEGMEIDEKEQHHHI